MTYVRCIVDQTRSIYDQPTLYRRLPHCTPAQHTICGERGHPRPFFNRLKNLSRSPRPLTAVPTNSRCILDQHTLSPIKARSLPIRPFFFSGRQRGLVDPLVWIGLTMSTCTRFWNRIKLRVWTICSFQVLNSYPWSLAKQNKILPLWLDNAKTR